MGIDSEIHARFVGSEVAVTGTIWVDGEKFEGALLGWGGPGVKGEDVFLVERGGGLDAGIGREIGKKCLEAVDRQAIVGASEGLLADGGFGTLGLGDDAGAHGGGGFVIGVVVEHRGELGAHVMLDMVGEHAEQDMGAHPRRGPVEDRSQVDVDRLQ
jgi:hypothetical protein